MKKISYILVSRNDSYCGDSVGRLVNTLNHLGSLLAKNKVLEESEVVLVDWASPEAPLLITLQDILNDEISGILKLVTVSPKVAKKYQKDSPFSEVHAMNCGFRRMSGKYFARIDQDTLVGQRFINWFYKDFEVNDHGFDWPKVAFCSRRNLTLAQSKPHNFKGLILDPVLSKTIEICHEQNHYGRLTDGEIFQPIYGGAVGILLVERGVYEKHKGFNENMIYMNNMDVEFFNRLVAEEPLYNLNLKINADFYHQHHSRADGAKNDSTQPHSQHEGSRQTNPLAFRNKAKNNVNRENWGLKDAKLPINSWA